MKFALVSQHYKQTKCFFPPKNVRIGSGRLHNQWWTEIPYTLQGPDALCLASQMNLLFAVDQFRKELLSCLYVFYQKFLRIMSKLLFNLLMQNVATLQCCEQDCLGFCVLFLFFKNKHPSFLFHHSFACGWIEAAIQDWYNLGYWYLNVNQNVKWRWQNQVVWFQCHLYVF